MSIVTVLHWYGKESQLPMLKPNKDTDLKQFVNNVEDHLIRKENVRKTDHLSFQIALLDNPNVPIKIIDPVCDALANNSSELHLIVSVIPNVSEKEANDLCLTFRFWDDYSRSKGSISKQDQLVVEFLYQNRAIAGLKTDYKHYKFDFDQNKVVFCEPNRNIEGTLERITAFTGKIKKRPSGRNRGQINIDLKHKFYVGKTISFAFKDCVGYNPQQGDAVKFCIDTSYKGKPGACNVMNASEQVSNAQHQNNSNSNSNSTTTANKVCGNKRSRGEWNNSNQNQKSPASASNSSDTRNKKNDIIRVPDWLESNDKIRNNWFDKKYNNFEFLGRIKCIYSDGSGGVISKDDYKPNDSAAGSKSRDDMVGKIEIDFHSKLLRNGNISHLNPNNWVTFKIGEYKQFLTFAYDIQLASPPKPHDRRQHLVGKIMIAPKSMDGNHSQALDSQKCGWIYCKSNNSMYLMPPTQQRLFRDTFAFFKPKSEQLKLAEGVDKGSTFQVAEDVQVTERIKDSEMQSKALTANGMSDHTKNYYVEGTRIDLMEDEKVEFKHFMPWRHRDLTNFKYLILDQMDKYCNAFWNANGGAIYFGIANDGTVKGTECCDRKFLDDLNSAVAHRVKLWHPVQKPVYKSSNQRVDFDKDLVNSIKLDSIKVIKGNYTIVDCFVIKVLMKSQWEVYGPEWKKVPFTDANGVAWEKLKSTCQRVKLQSPRYASGKQWGYWNDESVGEKPDQKRRRLNDGNVQKTR